MSSSFDRARMPDFLTKSVSREPKESLWMVFARKVSEIHADPVKERKFAFGFIGVIGVSAIFLGMIQIAADVRTPFLVKGEKKTSDDTAAIASIDGLKKKDTDRDGLNDFDELYTYGTSPYLADSDSDKIDDQDEVDQETDPNCPQGQTCQARTTDNDNTAADATNSAGSDELTPEQLRQLLIQSGAPQTLVDELSDTELFDLYEQTVAATGENPLENDSAANTNETSLSVDDVANPDADVLRELLVEAGADAAAVAEIDDATLMAIYQNAIQEETAQ